MFKNIYMYTFSCIFRMKLCSYFLEITSHHLMLCGALTVKLPHWLTVSSLRSPRSLRTPSGGQEHHTNLIHRVSSSQNSQVLDPGNQTLACRSVFTLQCQSIWPTGVILHIWSLILQIPESCAGPLRRHLLWLLVLFIFFNVLLFHDRYNIDTWFILTCYLVHEFFFYLMFLNSACVQMKLLCCIQFCFDPCSACLATCKSIPCSNWRKILTINIK